MKVYKLTPNPSCLDDRSWKASTYKGEMTICAETKNKARLMAKMATAIATDFSSGGVIYPPWEDSQLVSCAELEGATPRDEAIIIEPEEYDREWKR